MLIRKTLSIESVHGHSIARHIQMLSADLPTIEEGSLYPALQRMLVKEWVTMPTGDRMASYAPA